MTKLCIFVGMMLGSYGGWYTAQALGWSLWGMFMLSGVGSVLGVFLGWKYAQRFER